MSKTAEDTPAARGARHERLQSIAPPAPAFEVPAALKLLEEFAREPLDPWQIQLPE